MAIATYQDLCIDAVDAAALGRFWAGALQLKLQLDDDRDARLLGPTQRHTVRFNTVPEPKTVKNRIHWDVTTPDVQLLVDAGATLLRPRDEEISWSVLADPDGNEFCAFVD